MQDNGNDIDDPADTKETAGDDPQDADHDCFQIQGSDTIETTVNEAGEDDEEDLDKSGKAVQYASQAVAFCHVISFLRQADLRAAAGADL